MQLDSEPDHRGFCEVLIGDGSPLITLTAVILMLCGLFALYLSVTGHFLPHDVAFLGMQPQELCAVNECRIVHFMIHDRVSFGGALIAVGILYLWLATFPLRARCWWAWWTLLVSGTVGFSSFLAYLGYGYLDTWHGAGTLVLLPIFVTGLWRSRCALKTAASIGSPTTHGQSPQWPSTFAVGRLLLLATSACLMVGGMIIVVVGMTRVFVPQDLEFMNLSVDRLREINPRLIPLIAHDRAGFGGGVCCAGLTMFLCLWCSPFSRSLWQAVTISGAVGFGAAIAVHPAVGYVDTMHLAPAYAGAAMFIVGSILTLPHAMRRERSEHGE